MMNGTPNDESIEAAAGVATDVADCVDSPWLTNPSFRTRTNSPTRLPSKSIVWETVKRLASDHPKVAEGFTHICTEAGCYHFLKLTKPPAATYWSTTRAGEHLTKAHPATSGKNGVERAKSNQVKSFIIFRVIMR